METESVSPMFKALGDETRARIFAFLCSKCQPIAVDEASGEVRPITGVTVGEVCCHITGRDQFNSTISFHLKELRLAGLIRAEKSGKFTVCSAESEAIAGMQAWLDGLMVGAPQEGPSASPKRRS